MLQHQWVEAMFQLGRAIEAVQSATPDNGVFSQLMWKAAGETPPRFDLMDELLAAYANQQPDAEDVKYWTIRLAYLKGDYARVLTLMEQDESLLQMQMYGWEVENMHLYAHLHLDQFEAARILADQAFTVSRDPLRRAIVAAARRDLDETRLLLAGCIEVGYSAWEFYDYEFLNEALRSDEFAELSELYPPPEPAMPIE
jgi:hypothetical protein